MIKGFKDYDKVQGYQDRPQLPVGGYVMKIMGAEVKENRVGQYVQVSMDVAEGQYKDFFAEDYRAQQPQDGKDKIWHCTYFLNVPLDDGSEKDGWTKRRFKTFTDALESSNEGYHFDWDEKKFKGLMIGGLFNLREWEKDGRTGKSTNLAQVCSVEKIRTGKYKLPKDQLLSGGSSDSAASSVPSGFTVVHDDDLPF
jgi:hypothetical protein